MKFPLRGRKNVDLEGNEEGGEGGKEGRCSSEGEIMLSEHITLGFF